MMQLMVITNKEEEMCLSANKQGPLVQLMRRNNVWNFVIFRTDAYCVDLYSIHEYKLKRNWLFLLETSNFYT